MRECPACSRRKGLKVVEGTNSVFTCPKCNAIFSDNIYLGESYDYVLPYMTAENIPGDRIRYFDFTCLASKGLTRRHGWYDIESKRVVQTG